MDGYIGATDALRNPGDCGVVDGARMDRAGMGDVMGLGRLRTGAMALMVAMMAGQGVLVTPALAVPAKPAPVKIHRASPVYVFDYSYPAVAGAIPGLRAWLLADAAKRQREVAQGGREGKADSRTADIPFMRYTHSTDWQVVTNLPRWLSLSATVSEFAGGAHPNHAFAALLWDRQAGRAVKAVDLFTSPAALNGVIRDKFCAALDKERGRRRGEPVVRSSEWPNNCIDPLASTVILGSGDRAHFTRIGVLIAPYEAGSYAEGAFEVTLPVTPQMIAVVKPEYRDQFAPQP
ncbi:DUF4163 domain-containing protein [Novosphingobium sp. FSY-8]|uniref:DUF4163 domain-containing protein n=1 Tax=Novosphingobium ovatum TaxID=1908523 RepID=A0ABW9XE53_9SPHN|nr:DUF4163 domain-containing protein [Novosphingobium ovatum]NBC36828.1 DUF4163 domain-containing protein [Novosphingobium ovatum]